MADTTWVAGRKVPVNAKQQMLGYGDVATPPVPAYQWRAGQRVPNDPAPPPSSSYPGATSDYANHPSQNQPFQGGGSSQSTYSLTSPPSTVQGGGNDWMPVPAPRSNFQPPTLLDQGNARGRALGDLNLRQGLGAAQNVADGVNSAFDQYQFYSDRQADRNLKLDLVSKLMSGLGGLGSGLGGGGGLQGFQDTRSGQSASLPGGQTTNSITAQALPQSQIAGAAAAARNVGPVAPPASQRFTGPQRAEVNDIASSAARKAGAANANQIDRNATGENAQFRRNVELARAKQGIGNASWLTSLNQDNMAFDTATQLPLIRLLLSAVGSGVGSLA